MIFNFRLFSQAKNRLYFKTVITFIQDPQWMALGLQSLYLV